MTASNFVLINQKGYICGKNQSRTHEKAQELTHAPNKTKRYFDKYTAQNKPIYLICIRFDSKQRKLAGLLERNILGNLMYGNNE